MNLQAAWFALDVMLHTTVYLVVGMMLFGLILILLASHFVEEPLDQYDDGPEMLLYPIDLAIEEAIEALEASDDQGGLRVR